MAKIFEQALYPYSRSPDQDAKAPARRPVVVVGAGPVGLSCALDLALHGVPVVVLDDNEKVSFGSRAICFAKRTLEIFHRLGCGQPMLDKGVTWQRGKVFFEDRQVTQFDLLPEDGHRFPAFINLQQYYLELYLVERLRELETGSHPIEIRGRNKVTALEPAKGSVLLTVETPDGPYDLEADWVIACDGAASPLRGLLGLEFLGRVFEDNFLISDVVMQADFPSERWFWFDPPFNRGQSALLHKQPDNVWRIDLQLGWDIDKQAEQRPEKVVARLKAMLGDAVPFELEWVSIYTFQCRRMEKFRHGRVLFAGDSAHQVSPFGARGVNSGVQDTDNLVWKLASVLQGRAPERLLDSYDAERIPACDENILHSTRATDFITPKSAVSRLFRNAVLDLAERAPFARPLINSGRLSRPATYDGSPLNGADDPALPPALRPGAPLVDAPLGNGWLVDKLGGDFRLLAIDCAVPAACQAGGRAIRSVALDGLNGGGDSLRQRYLGEAQSAVYLVRPDQHIAARWRRYDEGAVQAAFATATGNA